MVDNVCSLNPKSQAEHSKHHQPTKDSLHQHKLNYHTKRSTEFPCSQCDKKYSLKCHLDEHVKRAHLSDPSPCEVCGKIFDNPVKLKKHLDLVHSGKKRPPKRKYDLDKSDWTCPICSKVVMAYIKSSHLQVHKEPKYTCDICGKKIKTKNNFDQHMNIHMNILEHECEPCNKVFLLYKVLNYRYIQAFPSKDALRQHLKLSVAHRHEK